MLGSNNWDGFIFAMSYECKLVSDDTTVSGFYQALHSGHLMEEFPEVVKCLSYLKVQNSLLTERVTRMSGWLSWIQPNELFLLTLPGKTMFSWFLFKHDLVLEIFIEFIGKLYPIGWGLWIRGRRMINAQ